MPVICGPATRAPTASPVYQLPEGVTGLGLNALVRNALVNLPRLRLHFEFPPLSSPSMRRFQLALQLERLLKAVVTVCLREQDVGGHTADLVGAVGAQAHAIGQSDAQRPNSSNGQQLPQAAVPNIQWRGFGEVNYKVLDQRRPELGTFGFVPGSAGNLFTGDFDLSSLPGLVIAPGECLKG